MWKQVGSQAIDIKGKKDEEHIGTYVGRKEIETKLGKQVIWQFTDEDEQPYGVYGFTNLNRCMEAVKVGEVCRVTYRGTAKVQTKFGLKDVHQVSVEVNDDSSINDDNKPPIEAYQ